jgi:peptidoglycan/LPS O-acetylase OafA/YrhL
MNKNNNFDFLRFLFALLVVISHSYPLSGSSESSQWIYQVTNGQIVLAQIGLSGFFIISGYFIFQSLKRSNSIIDYFKKRFLRLFPALIVVLFLTMVLVPFVYKSETPFFQNAAIYTYFPNNLSLYHLQPSIKGIFDTNSYHAINGSLWTIRYEFSLYIALSLLFFFRKQKWVLFSLISFAFLLFYTIYNFYLTRFSSSTLFGIQGYHLLNLGTFFIAGSLLSSMQFERLKYKKLILGVVLFILFLSLFLNEYNSVKHIILPIIIMLIGFMPLPFISTFGKFGDMSYGIYIYSFPIQQTLMYFFKMNTYTLMFTSVLLSISFGFLSWHWIEKRALKYKIISLYK